MPPVGGRSVSRGKTEGEGTLGGSLTPRSPSRSDTVPLVYPPAAAAAAAAVAAAVNAENDTSRTVAGAHAAGFILCGGGIFKYGYHGVGGRV